MPTRRVAHVAAACPTSLPLHTAPPPLCPPPQAGDLLPQQQLQPQQQPQPQPQQPAGGPSGAPGPGWWARQARQARPPDVPLLPPLQEAEHFVNLTNGIEALPMLRALGLRHRWMGAPVLVVKKATL
jgi:hypothetical protein